MGKNIKPTIIYRGGIEYLQCTKCSELKVADESNFYKTTSNLGLKPCCKICSKRYYVENSEERKTYSANRIMLLKLHNVNRLSEINA